MKITVNGEERLVETGVSLGTFLKDNHLDENSVVVEINKEIAVKEDFHTITFKENDSLEILQFVGGG